MGNMGTIDQSGFDNYTLAATAITKYKRVKLDGSGNIVVAGTGAADDWIGTVIDNYAISENGTVRLRNSPGTHKFVASAAISAYALVYGSASGKISSTASGPAIGFAKQAAAADGDIIEVTVFPTGLVITGVAGGYKIARGTVTLDGSNPTTAATGLTTIVAAVVGLKQTAAPADDPSWLSHSYSGSDGNLDIYAWKNTGGTDPTLVASTNAAATVDWIAIGT